ncbi:hypothetical protein BC938DRAFT_471729 [Jimgerdemannia flammicorona]|uniref:Uncharacterized protein n=1 Tax=Jimgerdemannia flammicorona TaxID=994334 RepID=A0A433QUF7_9FUNG|nr:hypothetical protein BC938DRAFT_471729 [Jimgerdemannia flammicorona]
MSDLYETACRTCGNIVNLDADDIRDTLRRADKYSEFAKDLESQDPTRALQNLHHSLRILKPLLHFSHATLLHTQQHLKDLCTQLRDWPAAYGHACALLDGYRVVYPCNHPLVGVLALATARMLLTCGDEIEVAIELLREVVMVMEVAFGAESAMTRRAREEEVEVTREFERKKLGRGIMFQNYIGVYKRTSAYKQQKYRFHPPHVLFYSRENYNEISEVQLSKLNNGYEHEKISPTPRTVQNQREMHWQYSKCVSIPRPRPAFVPCKKPSRHSLSLTIKYSPTSLARFLCHIHAAHESDGKEHNANDPPCECVLRG